MVNPALIIFFVLLPLVTSGSITLKAVANAHLSKVVNPALVGISLETSSITLLALGNVANPYVIGLLNNLRNLTGKPAQVRVGGTSGNTANITTINNPPMFSVMREISNKSGTKWVIGLNFASPVDPTIAVQEATKSAEMLGKYLRAFEIGNEPDLFPINRTGHYNIDDYVKEFDLYASAIGKIPSLPYKKIFQGLAFAGKWPIEKLLINSSFLADRKDILRSISIHQYQLNSCHNRTWKIADLLNHQDVRIHANLHRAAVRSALAHNKYVHLGETNSAICGGEPGNSNAFAAALWAVTWSLQHAYQNVTLLNFHTAYTAAYGVFLPSNKSIVAAPIYYGLLATAETVGNDGPTYLTELDFLPGAAYAAYDQSGHLKRVTVVDLEFRRKKPQTFTIPIPKSAVSNTTGTPTATLVRLKAKSVFAQMSITYGGQTVGSDGTLIGNRVEEKVKAQSAKDGWTLDVTTNGGEGVVVKF